MIILDSLQSHTLHHRQGDLFNPPALTNFWGSCQAAYDILAVRHVTFPPYSHGDQWLGALTINSQTVANCGTPLAYRWRPDRISRQIRLGELDLRTETVMLPDTQAISLSLTIHNTSVHACPVSMRVQTAGGVVDSRDGWHTPYSPRESPSYSISPWEGTPPEESEYTNRRDTLPDGSGLLYHSRSSQAVSCQCVWPGPDGIDRMHLAFGFDLAPGEKRTLYFLIAIGSDEQDIETTRQQWLEDPTAPFRNAARLWQNTLDDVFRPNNTRFSGNLPVLTTGHRGVQTLYQNAILGVLYMMRDHPLSGYGRTYTTLMPAYWVTTSFINDWSHSALLLAMLDPETLRRHLELWLDRDIYQHFGTEYVSGQDSGNWYSCNDYAMTRLITAYLRVTGDYGWIHTKIGESTVLDHLKNLVCHYQQLDQGTGLADYGDRNSLLECVSSYTHEVASLNAATVWMLRETADLLDFLGDSITASDYRNQATQQAQNVQTLYWRQSGYWACRQPDGSLVPVRHAWDFGHVGRFLFDDLPAVQLQEMIAFFENELKTETWMSALSPRDEDAFFSVRPDHQWNGCYPGWIADALRVLHRAGRQDVIENWLPGLAMSANQGPFSQGHFVEMFANTESGGARKAPTEWPYITDWAILSVGGFLDFVVNDIFGVNMQWNGLTARPQLSRWDPEATLNHLPHQGQYYTITGSGARPEA